MATPSDFYRHVMPYAPGAPEPRMDDAILNALREWCHAVPCWVEQLADLPVQPTSDTILFEFSSGIADKLLAAWGGGTTATDPMIVVTAAQIDQYLPRTGLATRVAMPTQGTLRLWPTPQDVGVVTIRAALTPNSTGFVPDEVLHRYGRQIANGAVAMLCMEPDKPYSNIAVAQAAGASFQSAIDSAKTAVFYGNARARAPARPSYF